MNSLSIHRQRIAIFDPDRRSNEHARRVIRATGNAPSVFDNIDEMRTVDSAARPYAMAYVGCPVAEEAEETVRDVRACLGDAVPLLLAVRPQALRRITQAMAANPVHVIPSQSRFSSLYLELTGFMAAHEPQRQPGVLAWGDILFRPALGTVQVGDAPPVSLPTFPFELALELFHNAGRSLSRAWLNTMLAQPSRAITAVVLQNGVHRLRQLLALQTPAVWQIHSLEDGAIRLEPTTPEAAPTLFSVPRLPGRTPDVGAFRSSGIARALPLPQGRAPILV